jgi:glycerate kinase
MNAKLLSGIETVIAHTNIRADLQSADWVITGEGSFDKQSLYGKVVSGIAKIASQSHTHLAVIAGRVSVPQKQYQKIGIDTAISCKEPDMSLPHALANCRTLLYSAAQHFVEKFLAK